MLQYLNVVMQWLEEDMVAYLDNWENSVEERSGFKDRKQEQNMMLLPLETRQGIRITSECHTSKYAIFIMYNYFP